MLRNGYEKTDLEGVIWLVIKDNNQD